jgi:hypothetical protein
VIPVLGPLRARPRGRAAGTLHTITMKVSTINLFCWLGSALLATALCGLIYLFVGQSKSGVNPFDGPYAKRLLTESKPEVKAARVVLDYNNQVLPNFITLNWTGKPAPKVVVFDKPDDGIAELPKAVPVSELIAVRYVQYDTIDPGGSRIFVQYIGELEGEGTVTLSVGDKLPSPFQETVVHRIEPESIVFSFGDEEREEERLPLNAFADMELIHQVGEGGVVEVVQRSLPQVTRNSVAAPLLTRQVSNGNWELGVDDARSFANDYQRILTQDVRLKTHYRNGKRSGIEVMSVEPGSIAARHGVEVGDIIISVNGHLVSSEQEAIKWAKNNADRYSVWEVVVENHGRRSTRVFHSPDN